MRDLEAGIRGTYGTEGRKAGREGRPRRNLPADYQQGKIHGGSLAAPEARVNLAALACPARFR